MKTHTINDWQQYFPFSIVRPEQERAVDFITNAFLNEQKRFVIVELGTGVGKSATGVAVARYLASLARPVSAEETSPGTYILTTQKVLQDQYVNDFGSNGKNLLRSIKSSSNYTCKHYTDQTCASSRRLLTQLRKQLAGTDFWNCCKVMCPYVLEKQEFLDANIGITNFSYFLAESAYAGKIIPRDLLVIDECHNVELELGKFIEVTFSEKFAKDVLKVRAPLLKKNDDDNVKAVFTWVTKSYKPALVKHIAKLEKQLEKSVAKEQGLTDISKQYEMLDKHICKVNRLVASFNPDNWVVNIVDPKPGTRSGRKYEFKPIDVSSYSHDMLYRFGARVLMMSATIVDHDIFCRSIGINPSDAAFLRIPSPFPIENRPIHYLGVGKMSMNNIESTLPKMAEVVSMLMDQHPNDKGIIHCVSFKVAQYLRQNVKSDRLVIHDSLNRDQVLRDHIDGSRPTVLLSPSMMEGVNLADDASRFQVLCKVPFPYLGDKVVKKRKLRDPKWYPFQTAKAVIQSMGRSVRNENDHAVSYILDEDWDYFFKLNQALFPDDFIKSFVTSGRR